MLDQDENKRLTKVTGPAPMAELLRRYWHPVAAVAEMEDRPIKPIRLFGEDLVLYRDGSGSYGLLDRYCPHRGASLAYGWVEEKGLRCSYHGWCFDHDGACLEQPFEDTVRPEAGFRQKVHARAYHVQAKAGLLWAYLGPNPVPCLWDWDAYYARGFQYLSFATLPCNWLQCQENSADPVHFEWLHQNWSLQQEGKPFGPRHLKVAFDPFEFGIVYRRVLSSTDESHDLWTKGRVCLWPNGLFVGDSINWNVPIDDETTLRVGWWIHPLPGERPFRQARIPYWYAPVCRPDGDWIAEGGAHQDFVAMLGQGRLADRSHEHLGESDRGVILLRKMLSEDLRALKQGEDPRGILRDQERNRRLKLPGGELAVPRRVVHSDVIGMAGQPGDIRDQLEQAWAEHQPK
jgi:5,5'-dehydrodivanillate O-demethylase